MEDSQDTGILEAMQTEALKAPEPGETKIGQDISGTVKEGAEEAFVPAVVHSIKSAGYSFLYNTRTGDKSKFNNNMLPRVMKQRWPDEPLKGKLIWSVNKPSNPPHPIKAGVLKCLLHGNSPNRSKYDAMGFPICSKDNLASPYQVRRHMMKKHKSEWEAIEQERLEAERQEDREFQRMLVAKATTTERLDAIVMNDKVTEVIADDVMNKVLKREAPLYVSNKDKKSQPIKE